MKNEFDNSLIKGVSAGNFNVVEIALRKGANPNAINKESEFAISCIRKAPGYGGSFSSPLGSSPQQVKNHEKIVKILIEKGANFNVVDNNGYSVLDFAMECGETGLVQYLMERKACLVKYQFSRIDKFQYYMKYIINMLTQFNIVCHDTLVDESERSIRFLFSTEVELQKIDHRISVGLNEIKSKKDIRKHSFHKKNKSYIYDLRYVFIFRTKENEYNKINLVESPVKDEIEDKSIKYVTNIIIRFPY
jgi:ankyrin repeat protein